MGKKVSIKTTTVVVTGTPREVLAANVNRNFLSLHNKGECNVLIKYGGNFGGANNEVQKVTFTPAEAPTSGSFKLKYGENKTAAIEFDAASEAEIEAAIQAVEGCSGVAVSGDFVNGFMFEFAGEQSNTNTPILEVTDNTLATDSTRGAEVQTILFSSTPTEGTYKLGYGTEKTTALDHDSNALAVQTALRLLTGLSDVDVADVPEGFGFTVTFTGTHTDKPMIAFSDNETLFDDTVIVDEVQTLYANMIPTEGSYRLQFKGQITSALDHDASATDIQTALRALSTIGADTTVAGTDLVTGMSITFLGVDASQDQPLVQPYAVDIMRHGEKLRMDVYTTTGGASKASVTASITETTKGVDDTALVGTVETLIQGLAYANEGTPMSPGSKITHSQTIPIDSVWAECDEDEALLEIQEG